MRRIRCAAVVVVVAASLFCSTISSHAEPSPSPSPSVPATGKPATAKEMAKRFAKVHPAPKKVAKHHKSAAPNKPAKITIPDNYSGQVKRLLADLKAGDLPKKRVAQTANQMLKALTGRSSGLSARYSGQLTSADLVAVSMLAGTGYQSSLLPVGTDSTASPSQRTMPQGAPSQPSCVLEDNLETCTVDGEHASVVYLPSRLTATQLADNNPADGVPDKAAKTVEALDSAWDYFHDVLGYTGPSSGRVWWGWNVIDLVNDRAASLPGGVIVAPDTDDLTYLVAHELFHQFQWPYMDSAFPLPSPVPPGSITDPVAVGDVLTLILAAVNLSNINWWMESTAEWATTRYANFVSQPGHDPRTDIASLAARSLGLFFETPSQKLAHGNPTTDSRQYGELAVVEYFADRTEDRFVRKTFEEMQGWLYLDGYSQIDNTLNDEYGYATADLLPWMWHAQYMLCDPADHDYIQGSLDGWWINTWCGYVTNKPSLKNASPPAGDVARPVHDARSTDGGTAAKTVSPGGAWFLDFALPGASARIVTLDVTSSDPSRTTIWVDRWAATPGEWCGGTEWSDPWGSYGPGDAIHLELPINSDCPNLTLSVTNTSLSGDGIDGSSQSRV